MQCFEYALAREQMHVTLLQQFGSKDAVAKANALIKSAQDMFLEGEEEARQQDANAANILSFINAIQPGMGLAGISP